MRWASLGAIALLLSPPLAGQQPASSPKERSRAAEESMDARDARPAQQQGRGGLATAAPVEFEPLRLLYERAYAEVAIVAIDALESADAVDEPARMLLRTLALAGLERKKEAAALFDRRLALGGPQVEQYGYLFRAAARLEDGGRMLEVLEAAARNIPDSARPDLNAQLVPSLVRGLDRYLVSRRDVAARVRLNEVLLELGWPGERDIIERDAIRLGAVLLRLDRRDRASAAEIARTIETPEQLLPLLILRSFDGLVGGDPIRRLEAASVRTDEATRAALAAAPRDASVALARVKFLRLVGRSEEAIAAAQPFLADVEATMRRSSGNWLVNEAVYALLDLGRVDEAVAVSARMAAMDLSENAEFVSQAINHISVLQRTRQPAAALAHAHRVEGDGLRYYSPFGRMWIVSGMVCALADLGRTVEAAAKLPWMRQQERVNPAALSHALLCLGRLGEAEALLLRRLREQAGFELVLSLQDYQRTAADQRDGPIAVRWRALRDRPAVRRAIERRARILSLPFSQLYWGAV